MKKYLLSLFWLFGGIFSLLLAENVPVDKAMQVATNFTRQMGTQQLRSGQPVQLAYTARPSLRSGASPEVYYYVFNLGNKNGFIVVSGEDRAYPVLGYATSGDFSYEAIPDNMQWWLQEYANQIEFACTNGLEQQSEIGQKWAELQTGSNLKSLKSQVLLNTASWSQETPYNDQCPLIGSERSVTGCVATAMAIVMKYHGYPQQGTGSHTIKGKTYSADFNTTYEWGSMKNTYTSYPSPDYTITQGAAVAKLMYHCGVSCDMNYGPDASSASLQSIAYALPTYFKYNRSIMGMVKGARSEDEWANLIKNELNNNRPIPYGGQSGSFGHAFVFDGYNDANQYHVNWGWGGSFNGWFYLSALNLGGQTYSTSQEMVINIIPQTGGTATNKLVLATHGIYRSEGLKLAKTPIQTSNFDVNVSTVVCEGSTGYEGNPQILSIALIDANGVVKEIVSSNAWRLNPTPGAYYDVLNFSSCKITGEIKNGDQICAVYYQEGTTNYKILDGSSGLPTRISPTGDDTPSTSYKITWNISPTGSATVKAENGYDANAVTSGGTFKFKVMPTSGYSNYTVTVKAGSTSLTPDASGVYTLSNVQSNIELAITLEEGTGLAISPLLEITDGVNAGLGMVTDRTDVKEGDAFAIDVSYIKNVSASEYEGYIGIALVDKENRLKEIIGYDNLLIFGASVYNFTLQYDCRITKKVESTDLLRVVESTDSGSSWRIVPGINNSLKVKGQTVDWCTVTMPLSVTGVNIRVLSGYTNKVVKGRAYSFKADPASAAYAVSVRSKGSRITRNIYSGAFEFPDIRENLVISVKGILFSTVNTTKTVTLTTAGTLIKKFTDDEMDYTQTLIVKGPVKNSDFIQISYLPEITSLDLSGASLANNTLESYGLSSSPKLTELVLPASITTIANNALSSCNALTRIVMNGSTPPTLNSGALSGISVSQLTIVVPAGSGAAYRSASVWKNYTIVEMASSTYQVLSRADRGAELVAESGYDAHSVASGDDFKFHVSVDPAYREWELKVEVDGLVLVPDGTGVYTISNIKSNKNVVISLTEVYRVTFVKPKEDVTMVSEAGCDADRIVAGSDFKFHLASRYTEDQLTVASNGVVLRPIGKTYTIYGIRENQQVTVIVHDVGNEKISAENVRIEVVDNKLCITHPSMKNVPVYVVSFDGTLCRADKLNGIYTELELPGKGAYIVSFGGFRRKIMVR